MLTSPNAIDWGAVVEENRRWIERLAAARIGPGGCVDDVLQEVNLAVTRSSHRPQRAHEIAPWLCKIVIRQCALVVRTQVRQQRKLDGLQRDRPPREDRAGDPIFWLLHREQQAIIREELKALEPGSRQLLIWKYLQKMEYPEIARRLGLSRHAAEYRVIEARKQLRRRLQARGIEEDG